MITLLGSKFSDHNYSTVPGIMVPNGSVSCIYHVSSLDSELAQAADGTALLWIWIFRFWPLHS